MLDYKSTGIQKLIFDRLCQIHDGIIGNDPEYNELGERPGEILQQLFAKLPPEDKKLLDEYDSGRMSQMLRQDELIYTQGLMDGMVWGYWVALVGRGVAKIGV